MKNISLEKGRKGLLALALAAALVSSSLVLSAEHANAAFGNTFRIMNQAIDVEGVRGNIAALNTDNTTYIAIRSLNKSIGLNTEWDKANNTVTVTGRGRELTLNLNDGSAMLNGQQIYGLPAIVQSNTTYVPFRFLLERMGYGVAFDTATKVIGIEAIKENDLKITTKVIKEASEKQSLIVHYPQLSGYANEAVQNKINALLKEEAETKAEGARKQLNQLVKDNAEFEAANPDLNRPPVTFDSTYTVTYNEQAKLSLYFDNYIYMGGAHGGTARVTHTFDLATGNELTLKDVVSGNPSYVSIINKTIQSQIKARGILLLDEFVTIEPDRDFFLKHNGVVVYFGQYEYTPYAAGMPEFEVPFEDFK